MRCRLHCAPGTHRHSQIAFTRLTATGIALLGFALAGLMPDRKLRDTFAMEAGKVSREVGEGSGASHDEGCEEDPGSNESLPVTKG